MAREMTGPEDATKKNLKKEEEEEEGEDVGDAYTRRRCVFFSGPGWRKRTEDFSKCFIL